MNDKVRLYRLQVHLSKEEYREIEDFWSRERFETRTAAVKELLRRGLARDREKKSN
jgi:metal-responsive CopG/Arc/MetJ family transcriptional regulator